MNILKLIRYKNLLILLLTQALMVGALITPLLVSYGMTDSIPFAELALLLLTTLLLAAGGYSINDYFDHKTDRINKPERVIPDKKISREQALNIYRYLTGGALISGFGLAWYLQSISLAVFFPAVAALLWYYSAVLKRMPLIGNLLVASLSALSIVSTAWVTIAHLQLGYHNLIFETAIPGELLRLVSFFALMAFLLNLVRELVKDAEDLQGDKQTGARTLPVMAGLTITRYLCVALILVTLFILTFFFYRIVPYTHWSGAIYLLLSTVLPLLWLSYIILNAKLPEEFRKASKITKVIMLSGSGYALVWLLYFNHQYSLFN